MHVCPPPSAALNKWLKAYPSVEGTYGHLLLEQEGDCDGTLAEALIPYFESAHEDARAYFHAEMEISLHPDADEDGAHAIYPNCLPSTARRGLFGEVMAGMITETYTFVGDHKWSIPIFLFRNHEDVGHYLFALARDPERVRQTFGRHGTDFLAIARDKDGAVARYITGEAKWRLALQPSVIDALMLGQKVKDKATGEKVHSGKGIWHQINRDTKIPYGVSQLRKLLRIRDPEGHAATIASLDRVLTVNMADALPRTNLVFIIGNDVPTREKLMPLIPWESPPEEYQTAHDLQVVEVILNKGEDLIDAIYDNLWIDE